MHVRMPEDWDDRQGWDAYYEAMWEDKDARHHDITHDFMIVRSLADLFGKKGWREVWVAGCGATLAPHMLAALGFDVWATDFSQKAIEIQEMLRDSDLFESVWERTFGERLDRPEDALTSEQCLHLLIHDFRFPFQEAMFDCVLNIRAFQGLSEESMSQAAQVHFRALKPGGWAFFSTMNVQGILRDHLEDALLQAGFYIPFNATERWYRAAIRETSIPHVFILGRPMPYRGHERYKGSDGEKQYEEDRKTLRKFSDEYRQRQQEEGRATAHLFVDGHTRIAQVIYNTG